MANVYVNVSTGANTGTGPISAPWATLTYALAHISSGDVINLNGGDVNSGNYTITVPCTIQSYGSGQATITAAATSSPTITSSNVVCTLNNLIVIMNGGVALSSVFWPIRLTANDGATHTGYTVTNCTVSGGFAGISFGALTNTATKLQGITVSGNTIFNCASYGINTSAATNGFYNFSNVLISNNIIHDIPGYVNPGGATGIGVIINDGTNAVGPVTISGNLIYNIGYSSSNSSVNGGPSGAYMYDSLGVVISGNVVHDISATVQNQDGLGVDIDLLNVNCSLIGNFCFNCAGCGYFYLSVDTAGAASVIAWNIAVNCATTNQGGIFLSGTGKCNVFNNTVAQQTGSNAAVSFDTGCSANKNVINNIFITPANVASVTVASADSGFVLKGNAYLAGAAFKAAYNGSNYTTYATFKTASGQETGTGFALTSNPLQSTAIPTSITPTTLSLANGFSLQQGNLLLQAGLNLSGTFGINPGTLDFLGNTLRSPYSVGAIDPPYNPGGGGPDNPAEQQMVAYLMRRRRRIKDLPSVPGYRARHRLR